VRSTRSRRGRERAEPQDAFAAAPFLPRYEGDYVKSDDRNVTLLGHYVEALDIRRVCHEMAAVLARGCRTARRSSGRRYAGADD